MHGRRDILFFILLLVTIQLLGQIAYGQANRTRHIERKIISKTAAQTYPMEYDADRPGSDYRDFDLDRADPNSCAASCSREDQCQAWTYVKPGTQGPKARCWLKNEVPDPVENDDCISGLKAAPQTTVQTGSTRGMEYNINRNGFDFKDMELKTDDPKLCMNACNRESRCMAWTYVKSGVQGESAHCWLKDQVPEPTEDENCISGVKARSR